MKKITVNKPQYPQIFGGIGFHNTQALLYPIIEKEHFNQILCKCYFKNPSDLNKRMSASDWLVNPPGFFKKH